MRGCLLAMLLAGCGSKPQPTAAQPTAAPAAPAVRLRAPSELASIANRDARSVALFQEAARVITSPRCMNCHPADRTPTQGDDRHPHVPMMRAEAGGGPRGLGCATCHQRANVVTYGETIASIPGHPHWSLAPASMAWQGKTVAQICTQLLDPARNGGKTLVQLHEHMAHDTLVGWAWNPGAGRIPAPGTQAQFGALITAWIETGARCPD
jgi:hypothetical protein